MYILKIDDSTIEINGKIWEKGMIKFKEEKVNSDTWISEGPNTQEEREAVYEYLKENKLL